MYAEAGCWLVENALVEEAQRQKDLDMWARDLQPNVGFK